MMVVTTTVRFSIAVLSLVRAFSFWTNTSLSMSFQQPIYRTQRKRRKKKTSDQSVSIDQLILIGKLEHEVYFFIIDATVFLVTQISSNFLQSLSCMYPQINWELVLNVLPKMYKNSRDGGSAAATKKTDNRDGLKLKTTVIILLQKN